MNNPLIRYLKTKHWDELTADISEFLWMIYGTSIHSQLEKYNNENVIKELKIVLPIDNWTLVGKADVIDLANKEILDHKTTSVWSVVYDHPDWDKQLNMYKWMAVQLGLPEAEKLTVLPFLRDWVSSKADEENYPDCQALIVPVSNWPLIQCGDYIRERIALYNQPEEKILTTPCTAEERWQKDTTWAVKKKGQKNAVRGGLQNSKEDAEQFIRTHKDKNFLYIEERTGKSTKCESYCSVREVCPYRKQFIGE